MSGPILFFLLIFVIDGILKSSKDRQKFQEDEGTVKDKTIVKSEKNNTINDLKRILSEELQKQMQPSKPITDNKIEKKTEKKLERQNISWEITKSDYEFSKEENKKPLEDKEKAYDNMDIRENLLNGIIFSEILSKPKSLRK